MKRIRQLLRRRLALLAPASRPAYPQFFEPLEPRVMLSLSVPAYHSLPGAPVALYLDFDGDTTPDWDIEHPGTTPAFDLDNNPTSFNADEQSEMRDIWQRVSEMFSIMEIDVTTRDPGAAMDSTTMTIVIGGDGAWAGGHAGVALLGSFADSRVNKAFVFSSSASGGGEADDLANPNSAAADSLAILRNEKTIANATAHEAGHAFGLEHQETYDAEGNVLETYNGGTADHAPIMGTADLSARALWWVGPSSSADTIQDDIAVMTSGVNHFGLRPDDYGDTLADATPLAQKGNMSQAWGVITTLSDVDVFSFSVAHAGFVSVAVDAAPLSPMLNAVMDVRDAQGQLVTHVDGRDLGASQTLQLPAGDYTVSVSSHGDIGDLGSYHVGVNEGIVAAKAAKFTVPNHVLANSTFKITAQRFSDPASKSLPVDFYLDSDDNGQFDINTDQYLGSATPDKHGVATLTVDTNVLPGEDNRLFAVPHGGGGATGVPTAATVSVQPLLGLAIEPKRLVIGDSFTLTARNVELLGTAIRSVKFYRDVNHNGRVDSGDKLLGADTKGADGWSLDVDSTGLKAGDQQFLAVSTGVNGKKQNTAQSSAILIAPPTIGGVTVVQLPGDLPFIRQFNITGLRHGDEPVTMLELYFDANGDGVFDLDDDTLLVHRDGTFDGPDALLRANVGQYGPGVHTFFVRAGDAAGVWSKPFKVSVTIM